MDRERVLAQQTVVVQGGKILALGPSATIQVPMGAIRVDGGGKYLIPGLGDCYLRSEGSVTNTFPFEQKLLNYLAAGVTTVQTVAPMEGVSALRRRAAAGEIVIPRIYAMGYPWPVVDGAPLPPLSGVAAQVAAYKAEGFEVLEFQGQFDPTTQDGAKVWQALVSAARREGLPLVWQTPTTPREGLALWLRRHLNDFRAIDGLWPYIPSMLLDEPDDNPRVTMEMAALARDMKRAGVTSCPRLFMERGGLPKSMYKSKVTHALPQELEDSQPAGMPDSQWTVLIRHPLRNRAIVRKLQDAGVNLLAGSGGHSNFYIVADIRSLVVAGLTPYQALRAGTRNMAEYFGTLASTGTVMVGKRADLVLLDGNPLVEIGNIEQPAGVMLGGQWLSRAELVRRLGQGGPASP